jgi:hypothetical protein
MSTFWIVVPVLSALVVAALALLVLWKVLLGKPTIASVAVQAGTLFVLAVPASPKRRELWIRYKLTLTVPPARGQSVSPGSFYGVTLRLSGPGRAPCAAGTSRFLGRGGLAPADAEHFGIVDYMYSFQGSAPNQTLATTVKVMDLTGDLETTVSGVLELAPANTLLEASVWVTG